MARILRDLLDVPASVRSNFKLHMIVNEHSSRVSIAKKESFGAFLCFFEYFGRMTVRRDCVWTTRRVL